MRNKTKIFLLTLALFGIVLISYADRGYSKKAKVRTSMNVDVRNGFKNNLYNNLNSGLVYKGSFISNMTGGNPFVTNNLITYQKGNTIYILPASQKVFYPVNRAGDPGIQIVIGSN